MCLAASSTQIHWGAHTARPNLAGFPGYGKGGVGKSKGRSGGKGKGKGDGGEYID